MPSIYRWCGTLNNYVDEDIRAIRNLTCTYCVWGREVAPGTGTPHLQLYVIFDRRSPKGLREMRRLFPRTHWTAARGTTSENYNYCTKDGNFEETGEKPSDANSPENGRRGREAERERWDQARALARTGNFDGIASDIFIRCYSSIRAIHRDSRIRPAARTELDNHWFWGESGTGKTRKAWTDWPEAFAKGRTKWWDGYQGEETVIIDDLDKFNVGLGGLIKDWGDYNPFNGEIKGGSVIIRPRRIIITSQYPIEEIWNDPETVAAIRRRFKITKFQTLGRA